MGEQKDGEHEPAQLHDGIRHAKPVAPTADNPTCSDDSQQFDELEQTKHPEEAQFLQLRTECENVVRNHRNDVNPEPARHVVRGDVAVVCHRLTIFVQKWQEELHPHVAHKHEIDRAIEPEQNGPVLSADESNLVRQSNSRKCQQCY